MPIIVTSSGRLGLGQVAGEDRLGWRMKQVFAMDVNLKGYSQAGPTTKQCCCDMCHSEDSKVATIPAFILHSLLLVCAMPFAHRCGSLC